MSLWIGLAVICLAAWGIADLVMRFCRFVAMTMRKPITMPKPRFFEDMTPFSQLQYTVTNAIDAENAMNAVSILAPTTHEGLPYFSQSVEKLGASSFIVTMKYRRRRRDAAEADANNERFRRTDGE
jgi:hypothetical protein